MFGRLAGLPGEMQPHEMKRIREDVDNAQYFQHPGPDTLPVHKIMGETAVRYRLPHAARELLRQNDDLRDQLDDQRKGVEPMPNMKPPFGGRRGR